MKKFIDKINHSYEKFFIYLEKFAHSKHKLYILFIMSFLEQSISPVMPDILIIPIAMYKKYSAFFVANFAAVSSLLGGITIYIICSIYGEVVLTYLDVPDRVNLFYGMNAFQIFATTVFVGFTPIPDKIYTVLGGLFKVNATPLLAGMYVGKLIRFYIVAYLAEKYGLGAKMYINKYLKSITYILTFLIFIYVSYLYFN